jgi:hypothetical protein
MSFYYENTNRNSKVDKQTCEFYFSLIIFGVVWGYVHWKWNLSFVDKRLNETEIGQTDNIRISWGNRYF